MNPLGNKHIPKTRIFEITQGFARFKKLPRHFVAKPILETPLAFYLYGHGTLETVNTGQCCVCGRTLTHPVSIKLGIGPECGGHYWDWNLVGGFNEANVERLMREIGQKIKEIKIDGWIPKSRIVKTLDSQEEILIPEDHPMRVENKNFSKKGNGSGQAPPSRRAIVTQKKSSGKYFIKMIFPYSPDDVARVRTLPNREYIPEGRFWVCPITLEAIEKLIEWEFDVDPMLKKKLEQSKVNVEEMEEVEVEGLKGELYPFQKKGVSFIEKRQGRALIGDEMGLGKTIQALAWLQLHPEHRPVIIVVPASLKLNWAREAQAWMPNPSIQILSGTSAAEELKEDIFIINYDILPAWLDKLLSLNPKVLITDECHFFKNNKAKRTKAIMKLGKNIPHVIALSGTPIVNRPIEFFNAIKLIDEAVVPRRFEYAQEYCAAKNNGYGWDFSGASNTEKLHKILTNTIMIRRKKSQVLKDLPDKVRTFVPMDMGDREFYEYKMAERNFIQFVRQHKGKEAAKRASNAAQLAEIEGLRQLAVRGKMDQAIQWIRDFIDTDGKLVVFATHTFAIDTLMLAFGKQAVKVDGSVTGQKRQDAVDKFQTNDNIRLFVGNIKAAGVGITLTAASNVAFLELPWTPGDLTQAEDRCHRIGQKDSVSIYYLLADDTIEYRIAALIDAKRKVLDKILDGEATEQESLLTEIMNEYAL